MQIHSPKTGYQAKSWSPQIGAKLDSFTADVESGKIDKANAVFDFDGTVCAEDIGRGFLKHLIDNDKLPEKHSYDEFESILDRDHHEAVEVATTWMAGMPLKEVQTLASEFAADFIPSRAFEPQRQLIQGLQTAGATNWVVSASCHWLVQAAAPHLGIPSENAIGLKTHVEDGILTDKLDGPLTSGVGKVQAIQEQIGEPIHLVSGNSWSDHPMLQRAESVSLLINPQDDLDQRGQSDGMIIQHWPGRT